MADGTIARKNKIFICVERKQNNIDNTSREKNVYKTIWSHYNTSIQ